MKNFLYFLISIQLLSFNCYSQVDTTNNKNTPFTIIKGKLSSSSSSVKIKVVDKATGQRIKYVYNPNPKNGKYLLILTPGRNYDMFIMPKGYFNQHISFYIPNQSYFHELFQTIDIKPISVLNKTIGENISICNTFYDIYNDSIQKDYSSLRSLIEKLMNATDSLGYNSLDTLTDEIINTTSNDTKDFNQNYSELLSLIEEAIETTNKKSLETLNKNTLYKIKSSQNYFYKQDKTSNLVQHKIGSDNFLAKPEIFVSSKTKNITEHSSNHKSIAKINSQVIFKHSIYFSSNDSKITKNNFEALNEITKLLVNYPSLDININGYSDSIGDENQNLILSQERAKSVSNLLLQNNVDSHQINTQGFGENHLKNCTSSEDTKLNRRVDLIIFETIE